MKKYTKLISLLMLISILASFSLSVSAGAYDMQTDSVVVSAGGSDYTDDYSKTNAIRRLCYIRLSYFKFTYYPDNSMPSGYLIYARLYKFTYSKASELASFSQTTSAGHYNYDYLANNGWSDVNHMLKSNSSYDSSGYTATFDYSANPYV